MYIEQKTENLGSNPSKVGVIGNFGQIRQMKKNIFRENSTFLQVALFCSQFLYRHIIFLDVAIIHQVDSPYIGKAA